MFNKILCILVTTLFADAFAHTSVFLQNKSSIPLLSPYGVVIKPSKTDVWRVVDSDKLNGYKDSVNPKPKRGIHGCNVSLYQTHKKGGTHPLIVVSQKGKKLSCIVKDVAINSCGKKHKAEKNKHIVEAYKPDDELYILSGSETAQLPKQIDELMVYAVPTRKPIVKDSYFNIQHTKIVIMP